MCECPVRARQSVEGDLQHFDIDDHEADIDEEMQHCG